MKVFYVNSGLQGSYTVRCLLPLQANGFDGDRTTFLLNQMTPEDKARGALNAEIVVFHRPIAKQLLELARILKQQGKKIVMDNDDTLKDDNGFKFNEYMNEKRVEQGMEKIDRALNTFAREADLITCTTEFLKKEYEKLNDNVVVLPNCVDPFYWPKPKRNETDIVRIGITGSVGITNDVDALKPIIDHYQNDKRVRLVLLSIPPKGQDDIYKELYSEQYAYWSSVNIEWHPFCKVDEYPEKLNDLKFDFIIVPRSNSYFNRCKSNLKFLENSLLQIPTIAQAFSTGDSPYQGVEDQKYLLLADTTEEWIAQIELFIGNKELRREIGIKAQKYILENYNINDEKNYKKWYNAYSELMKK